MLVREDRPEPQPTRAEARLAAALAALLDERGFDEISVRMIAARAGVNRSTFYTYFSDKYGMVDDLFRERFAQLVAQHTRGGDRTAEAALRGLLLAVIAHWAGATRRCWPTYRRFEAQVEARVIEGIRGWLSDWLERRPEAQGLGRRRRELVAAVIGGALYQAASDWRERGDGQSAEDFADEAIPLIAATLDRIRI